MKRQQAFLSLMMIFCCGLQCSATTLHIQYHDNDLLNNSYINLNGLTNNELMGIVIDCAPGFHGGEEEESDDASDVSTTRALWIDPSGNEITSTKNNMIYAKYGRGKITLKLQNDQVLSGIYKCMVDDQQVSYNNEIASVGLYLTEEGDIRVWPIVFESDFGVSYPRFTLTCISTGGPATTVTWTRDNITITEETVVTVLNDPVTAQYTHTLILTETLGGLYTCTVANSKPSSDTAEYYVKVAFIPSGLRLCQYTSRSILVQWTPPPFSANNNIGYQIEYVQSNSVIEPQHIGFQLIDFNVHWFLLRNLSEGYTYRVRIRCLSENLPSNYTLPQFIELESDLCSRSSEESIICEDVVQMCFHDDDLSTENISPTPLRNYTLQTTMSPGFSDVSGCDNDDPSPFARNDIRVTITGAIVIFLVGVAVGIGICGMLIVLFCLRKKRLHRKSRMTRNVSSLTQSSSRNEPGVADNSEGVQLSTLDNQLYGEMMQHNDSSRNDGAVRDNELSMTRNKAYQHSPNGTTHHLEDLDQTLPSSQAYRSMRRRINENLEHSNERDNTLITAIKAFQSTRLREPIRAHRHADVNRVSHNQVQHLVTRETDEEDAGSHDVPLCHNVAYREPTGGPLYGDYDDDTTDIPYYSYPTMI